MATQATVLLTDNDRHRKYTGVTKFHAAGYYGEKIIAASGESWAKDGYNPGGLVSDPFGTGIGAGHPVDTAATFFQVAPKAQLVMLPASTFLAGTLSTKKSYDEFITKVIPAIKEKNITNMFVSLIHNYDALTLSMWKAALPEIENFNKLFFALGNKSTDEYNPITDLEEIFAVAAYTLMVSGEAVPAGYSSVSVTADFAAPSMIRTNIDATKPSDSGDPNTGTSFSTPWLCGMSCLVDEFFIDKTGKPLTRANMYQFMLDNCVDMGDKGFDNKTGHGAVILPDPASIDIAKYQPSTVDTPVVDPAPAEPPVEEKPEAFVPGIYKVVVKEGTYLSVRSGPDDSFPLVSKLYRDDTTVVHNTVTADKNTYTWATIKSDDGTMLYTKISFMERVADYTAPEDEVQGPEDPLKDFDDKSTVSSWAVDAMRYMVKNGIITGSSNFTLDPAATITKEQLAVVLYRYMKHLQ